MHTQSRCKPHVFPTSEGAPPAFQVMLKPTGALCNLDCQYCFYLPKQMLCHDSRSRMAETLLEDYTHQSTSLERLSSYNASMLDRVCGSSTPSRTTAPC
jgi:hypothetical protein